MLKIFGGLFTARQRGVVDGAVQGKFYKALRCCLRRFHCRLTHQRQYTMVKQ
jgi:hypothetical protein